MKNATTKNFHFSKDEVAKILLTYIKQVSLLPEGEHEIVLRQSLLTGYDYQLDVQDKSLAFVAP